MDEHMSIIPVVKALINIRNKSLKPHSGLGQWIKIG